MMQRLLVGTADVHARAAAHGFEPLQHLDVGGGIAVCGFGFADGAGHGFWFWRFGFWFWIGCRQVVHELQASLRRRAFARLPTLVIGFAERIAQGPETKGWHGFLSP